MPDFTIDDFTAYWDSVGVKCDPVGAANSSVSIRLDVVAQQVGLPNQDWWPFAFYNDLRIRQSGVIEFGTYYDSIFLAWDRGSVIAVENATQPRLVNSSFHQFCQSLVIFDNAYRRIQNECPGDSGEDWDKGDVIIDEMGTRLAEIDPDALSDRDGFWRFVMVDVNG